jgi:hypothetical protein
MIKEFNLSEQIVESQIEGYKYHRLNMPMIPVECVREFIRLLKEEIKNNTGSEYGRIFDIIDKLAGQNLI